MIFFYLKKNSRFRFQLRGVTGSRVAYSIRRESSTGGVLQLFFCVCVCVWWFCLPGVVVVVAVVVVVVLRERERESISSARNRCFTA